MKVFKQVNFTVRIREYESAKVEIGAEMTVYDLGYDDLDLSRFTDEDRDQLWDRLWNTINTEVEQQQIEALREIAAVSPEPNLATQILQRKVTNGSSKNHTPVAGRRIRIAPDAKPDPAAPGRARTRTPH